MNKTMMRATMGMGLLVMAAQQLSAQPRQCAPRADVVKKLEQTYNETRRGLGLARQGAVMEVYASSTTGSWTITVTLPDGRMCLVASGESYEPLTEALPPNT